MNHPKFRRFDNPERVLFVWDGTEESIKAADQVVSSIDVMSLFAVHALPHEAIDAYATIGYAQREPTSFERKLLGRFKKAGQATKNFREVNLEILFGERITEVVRFANRVKAQHIITSRFVQSSFSTWVHGNLNRRLAKISDANVIFVEGDRVCPPEQDRYDVPNSSNSQTP